MAEDDQRGAQRSSVMLIALVRFAAAPHEPRRLRVRDISAGGARLDWPGEARVGEAVSLEFPALGQVAATVARVGVGVVGVRFARPIDVERARRPVTGDFSAPVPPLPLTALRRV